MNEQRRTELNEDMCLLLNENSSITVVNVGANECKVYAYYNNVHWTDAWTLHIDAFYML